MHFSTIYAQLLAGMPPDLQEYTIQYRQLTKVVNKIAEELSSHGFNPTLLHKIFEHQDGQLVASSEEDSSAITPPSNPIVTIGRQELPRAIYELRESSEKIEPQLRIVEYAKNSIEALGSAMQREKVAEPDGCSGQEGRKVELVSQDDNLTMSTCGSIEIGQSTPRGGDLPLMLHKTRPEQRAPADEGARVEPHEVTIPLVWDSRFFELLCTMLDHMATHLKFVEGNFMKELEILANKIGENTRPSSSSHSVLGRKFHPLSPLKDHANAVCSRPSRPSNVGPHKICIQFSWLRRLQSDLYPWREIFLLYVEAEVFENMHSKDGRERSVEESERRLQVFVNQVARGPRNKFRLKQSSRTLEMFLRLTASILNVKKLLLANSEATHKILEKRTRRTALPFPSTSQSWSGHSPPRLALIQQIYPNHLPRILAQAIGESLIPIIPYVDDYSCLICTSIAFKPIRLYCKHVFCVRCLVKMQKRGKDNCPMCRARSVLIADRTNVDWALMNFMQDWFPSEIKEKLKVDEKEVNAEGLAEFGYTCVVM